MNIPKSIEILTDMRHHIYVHTEQDIDDALKLGIEALEEVKMARHGDPALDGELLPGET